MLEFSRYLNQRLRNLKPGKEVNSLLIPIILALIVEEFMSAFTEITEIAKLLGNFRLGILIFYIAMMILFAILAIMLYNIISPFWKDNFEENFVTDYKEIIDEMIKQLENKNSKEEKEE